MTKFAVQQIDAGRGPDAKKAAGNPAAHWTSAGEDVDGRDKPGHDEKGIAL